MASYSNSQLKTFEKSNQKLISYGKMEFNNFKSLLIKIVGE